MTRAYRRKKKPARPRPATIARSSQHIARDVRILIVGNYNSRQLVEGLARAVRRYLDNIDASYRSTHPCADDPKHAAMETMDFSGAGAGAATGVIPSVVMHAFASDMALEIFQSWSATGSMDTPVSRGIAGSVRKKRKKSGPSTTDTNA